MTAHSGEPLDDALLSLTAINALEIAASRRDGRPMGTLDILLAVLSVDLTWGWESVQVEAGFVTEEDMARFTDPEPQAGGTWHDVPLTATATEALAAAARLATHYKLTPLPGGALVLGLLADSRSAASKALLSAGSVSHPQLLALIQENVLDTSLADLDLGVPDRAVPAQPGPSKATKPLGSENLPAAGVARARVVEGREEPGSVALLTAAIDLSDDLDLIHLLASMLIDRDELAQLSRELKEEDVPAVEVVEEATRRFGVGLDPAGLIVASTLPGSPRMRRALREAGLPPKELAAQVAEWRAREEGGRAVSGSLLVVGAVSIFASIAASVLLVLSVLGSGAWWQLLLLFGVWSGYPKEGPWVGGAIALLLLLLVNPVTAAAQAVGVGLEIAQAWIERNLLWVRTGIRISIRQQRHVVARLL